MLYAASSSQTRRVVEMLSSAGHSAEVLGRRLLSDLPAIVQGFAINLPNGMVAVRPWDERALIASFALKTMEHLIGARVLLSVETLGPATVEARVLLEIYIYLTYILEKDTNRRIMQYRAFCQRERVKALRGLVDKGYDTSSHAKEELRLNSEILQEYAEYLPNSRYWTGVNVSDLAERLGIGFLYASLYRGASSVIHSADLNGYNPLTPSLQRAFPQEFPDVPMFMIGHGFWGLNDVMSFMFTLDTVPVQIFGRVADFLGVSLSVEEQEQIVTAHESLSCGNSALMSTGEFARFYPELHALLADEEDSA